MSNDSEVDIEIHVANDIYAHLKYVDVYRLFSV